MDKIIKRKMRFFNFAVLFIAAVLSFAIISFFTYIGMKNNMLNIMKIDINISTNEQLPPAGKSAYDDNYGLITFNANKMPIIVAQHYENESGFTIINSSFSISSYLTNTILQSALSSNESEGYIKKYDAFFYKRTEPNSTKIVLSDANFMNNYLFAFEKRLILYECICFIVLCVVYELIIVKFSLHPLDKIKEDQTRILADISHDLKTPIAVIYANIGVIKSHEYEKVSTQIKWIENVEAEAQRMKTLVNGMLQFAKSSYETGSGIRNRIDFSKIVMENVLKFEAVGFESNVSINSVNVQNQINIKADENDIRHILEILFDNAIKYSDNNGVVEISLIKKHRKAIFTINNFGEIINDKDIEYIFERFFMADRSREKQEKESYGLGLSIADNLVKKNSGTIKVESNTVNGTTFTLTFKIHK